MRRYEIYQDTQRLTFRKSRKAYAINLLYLLLSLLLYLGFYELITVFSTRDPFARAFSHYLFDIALPLVLGGMILCTLMRMMLGGPVYILDRPRHLFERNRRPLCQLGQLHHVELRVGIQMVNYHFPVTNASSLILSIILLNGREIILDETQNEEAAAALAEQIAEFAEIPFGPTPMATPGLKI